ncbi:hypothetical protein DSL72_000043 [Monilinia vaccinii-corymbosi]|uniref:Uncharacterized protein n=1 Tax=Monilinia vaccinii-corymbosi TaxID=61207 RepID=A0A8A3P991_9HELO|nr:hypothetical protein DSL72_000043 [Monilinia vaccinii-corymbosi]
MRLQIQVSIVRLKFIHSPALFLLDSLDHGFKKSMARGNETCSSYLRAAFSSTTSRIALWTNLYSQNQAVLEVWAYSEKLSLSESLGSGLGLPPRDLASDAS